MPKRIQAEFAKGSVAKFQNELKRNSPEEPSPDSNGIVKEFFIRTVTKFKKQNCQVILQRNRRQIPKSIVKDFSKGTVAKFQK